MRPNQWTSMSALLLLWAFFANTQINAQNSGAAAACMVVDQLSK